MVRITGGRYETVPQYAEDVEWVKRERAIQSLNSSAVSFWSLENRSALSLLFRSCSEALATEYTIIKGLLGTVKPPYGVIQGVS